MLQSLKNQASFAWPFCMKLDVPHRSMMMSVRAMVLSCMIKQAAWQCLIFMWFSSSHHFCIRQPPSLQCSKAHFHLCCAG